jgi:hypothetical protein
MAETETQQPLGAGAGKAGEGGKKESRPTRYRVLWGRMPDPEEDGATIVYREVLNPDQADGAYIATSAETARRAAFRDERTDQHPHIQKALRAHGVRMRHVALSSWGDDDEEDVLRVVTSEDLKGRV